MKIGILTLPLHTNYGGILQAYALQTVLERMGHEVSVIEKEHSFQLLPTWKKPIAYTYRFLKKLFVNSNTIIRREIVSKEEYPIISQYTQRFIQQYIHSHKIDRLEDIQPTDFDAIIVGSDQIWRPVYFYRMLSTDLSNAFLGFTEGWNIRRIAYAASFGVDVWEFPVEKKGEFVKCANLFNGISVRERSGISLCKDNLNIDAVHVLDPTMLLDVEDYMKLVENAKQVKSEGNLFCYILDTSEKKEYLVNKISSERKLKPFHVKAETLERTVNLAQRIHKPVEAWIRGFMDAEFVITDSFHACVFSILFKKPFVAVGNAGRGMSRFSSLLDMFGLNNHLLHDVSEYKSGYDYSVNNDITAKLNVLKQCSMEFLISNLN